MLPGLLHQHDEPRHFLPQQAALVFDTRLLGSDGAGIGAGLLATLKGQR